MANYNGLNHGLIKKRIEALINKAESGDIYSMRLLAYAYSHGEYFPKDFLAAQAWLRKAEELGSDYAKKELAKLLSEGNGTTQNLEEAFDIYHELMLDCDVDAMMEVGFAYKLGKGVPQDEKKGSFYIHHAFDIGLDLTRDENKQQQINN
jgi:TPR repeat protein